MDIPEPQSATKPDNTMTKDTLKEDSTKKALILQSGLNIWVSTW